MIVEKEPERWSEGGDGSSETTQQRMGRLFRDNLALKVPSEAALRRHLRATVPARVGRAGRLALILMVALAFAGTTGVVAGGQVWRWLRSDASQTVSHPVTYPVVTQTREINRSRRPSRIAMDEGPLLDSREKFEAPPPQIVAVSPPSRIRVARPVTPPVLETTPPAARETHPSSEAEALSSIYRLLRVQKQPALALTEVEGFLRDHPDATLRSEAKVAQVQALMQLGRNDDALQILTDLKTGTPALDRMIATTRAELLASVGRCGEARQDFDRVVDAQVRDGFEQRALYGRATCRVQAGDEDGARNDLQRYLRDHPQGSLAERIRAELER